MLSFSAFRRLRSPELLRGSWWATVPEATPLSYNIPLEET